MIVPSVYFLFISLVSDLSRPFSASSIIINLSWTRTKLVVSNGPMVVHYLSVMDFGTGLFLEPSVTRVSDNHLRIKLLKFSKLTFLSIQVFEERITSNGLAREKKGSKLVWNMLAWLAAAEELSQPKETKEDKENKVGLQTNKTNHCSSFNIQSIPATFIYRPSDIERRLRLMARKMEEIDFSSHFHAFGSRLQWLELIQVNSINSIQVSWTKQEMLRFMSSIVVFRKEIYSLDSYQVPTLSEDHKMRCCR